MRNHGSFDFRSFRECRYIGPVRCGRCATCKNSQGTWMFLAVFHVGSPEDHHMTASTMTKENHDVENESGFVFSCAEVHLLFQGRAGRNQCARDRRECPGYGAAHVLPEGGDAPGRA